MVVLFAFVAGVLALLYAIFLIFNVTSRPSGSPRMVEISDAIKNGANAYLFRQYKTLVPIIIILSIVLFFVFGWVTVGTFLLGAVLSALAGYIGMNISVRANVRTAEAAKSGLANALNIAFRGGAVTGLVVAGLALLGVTAVFYLTQSVALTIGFGFGASLISLFMRVGGGIFTKAADVGADLVGKIEKGIPEDDPRNPAVIADNVGDCVGDCAGMAADLFESYGITLVAAMILGVLIGGNMVVFPLAIGAAGIIASVIGTFFVRLGKNQNIWNALFRGVLVTAVISAIMFYLTSTFLLKDIQGKFAFSPNISIFLAAVVGLVVTVVISYITEFYTGRDKKPVREVAEASKSGPAINIISGLALGLRSTFPTTILIISAILAAYYLAGVIGIAIAALGMLSVTGMIVAVDSYGPITDNAGGIAEMSKLPPHVRKVTDALDAVGNTTKAVTKGFAIGSAALAALSLFVAYAEATQLQAIDVLKPQVVIGLFIGGMIPFLVSSLLIRSVGKAAFSIVEEVRRQFKTIKGLMQGKAKPDYGKCVDITTRAALKEFVTPGVIAIVTPLSVGFILGPEALGGMLAGSIVTGFLLAVMQTVAGGAWDNTKKFIEAGNLGGKGSFAHVASVVGDTVGDGLKDTSGPSQNPLIKVMNMVALLFASLIVAYSLL